MSKNYKSLKRNCYTFSKVVNLKNAQFNKVNDLKNNLRTPENHSPDHSIIPIAGFMVMMN